MGLLPLSRFSYRQDVLRGHRILSENIPRHQHLHWNLFFKLEAYVSGEVKKQQAWLIGIPQPLSAIANLVQEVQRWEWIGEKNEIDILT